MRGVEAILENTDGYQLAEDMYEGNVQEVFANPKMAALLGEYGDAFHINLAKIPVNVIADRLEVAAITVPDSESDTAELQEKVWDANELLMRCKNWTRKTCEYGDGYVFVWEGEEPGTVDLVFNNPKTTRVIYDAETECKPEYAIKLWREGKHYRCTLYYPDLIQRWVTGDNEKPENPMAWRPYIEDDQAIEDWEVENPYGVIPIFHFRNDEPYGRPEHRDAYGPQNAVNKIMASWMTSIDFQAFPQRWGLRDPSTASEEDDGIDWAEDDANAASVSRQNESKLKAGAGEFWNLEGYSSVGQFEPANPQVFNEPFKQNVRSLSVVTATPLHFFDPSGDQPSAESRRAANEPTDKKAEDRQQRVGSSASKMFSFSLHVVQRPGTPYTKEVAKKVDVRWASPGVVSDLEGWETVKAKVEAGMPLRVAILEAGYTAEQCDQWGLTSDTSDAPLRAQIAILTELAQALQGLGTGVSLEILEAKDVKGIIDDIVSASKDQDNEQVA
jgi:hypothetical protein